LTIGISLSLGIGANSAVFSLVDVLAGVIAGLFMAIASGRLPASVMFANGSIDTSELVAL